MQLESDSEKICRQKLPALKRCCTEFEWELPDWSLLYDTNYSKGIMSDAFTLKGIKRCSCRICLNPKDGEGHITILFSDPALILAARVQVHTNKHKSDLPDSFCLSPVLKSHRLQINIPFDKKKLWGVLNFESSEAAKDTLTIVIKVLVIPIPEPLISENPPTDILKKIKALFDDKKLCDVTLVLGDNEIPVHKAILAANSQVFEAMFSNEMSENEKSKVNIVDVDADVFQEFLDYLYTGEANDLEESVEEMLMLADKYDVNDLEILCEDYMFENLDAENVVQYLLLADKFRCTQLKEKALKFLEGNPDVFLKVVEEGDPEVATNLKKVFEDNSQKN